MTTGAEAVARGDAPPGSFVVDAAEAVTREVDDVMAAGCRTIVMRGDVVLGGADPAMTLGVIRLLREAAAVGLPVLWYGTVEGIDPLLLVHLTPPQPDVDEGDAVTRWRREHRPGLCYYRQGPDFVLVKDVREARARFTFDGERDVKAFDELRAVVEVDRMSADASAVFETLEHERLALRCGDVATLLPYRMRRWPVPALEV